MFWKRLFGVTERPAATPPVLRHALIDSGSDTLVAIGLFPPTLTLLAESMLDTIYVPGIVSDDLREILTAPPRNYPEWSWSFGKRQFRKTNPAIITDDMRNRADFAATKLDAIARAVYTINRRRDKVDTGLFMQPEIYAQKEAQARTLKNADFDERLVQDAPYVVQYADIRGIPIAQAADEILLKAQLDREHLEKTERTRLTLFKKIKLANNANELNAVLQAFHKDGIV